MRKLSLILLVSFFASCAGLQNAEKSDFGKLESVQNVNLKKDDIYDKIMVYVATRYNSPKKVMEYCDKGQGIITFNGAVQWFQSGNPLYYYYLHYKITINIKDTKYKIVMTPLHWVYSAQGQTGMPIKDQAPAYTSEFRKIDLDITAYLNNKYSDDNF